MNDADREGSPNGTAEPDQFSWRRVLRPGRLGALSTSTVVQIGLSFATMGVVGRTYGVDGVGLLSVALAASLFASSAVDMTLGLSVGATVVGGGGGRAERAAFLRLRWATLSAVLLVALGLVAFTGGQTVVVIAAIGAIAGGLSSMGDGWLLLAAGNASGYAVSDTSSRVATLLVAVFAAVQHMPIATVVVGYVVGSSCSVLLSYLLCRGAVVRLAAGRSPGVPTLFATGLPQLGARLLSLSAGQGAPLVLAGILGPVQLGVYSASDRLVRALQSLLYPLALAMFPHFAALDRSDAKARRRSLRIGVGASLAVATTLVVGTVIVAPLAIRLVFGPDFAQSVAALRVEVLLLVPFSVSNVIVANVFAVHRMSVSILGTAVAAFVTLCAGLVLLSRIPSATVAAAIMVVVEVGALVAAYLLLRRSARSIDRQGP